MYETDRKELSSAGSILGIVSALNAVGVLMLVGAAVLLLAGIPASMEPEVINLSGGLGSIQGDDEFQPAVYAVFAGAAGSTVISALILFALSHIVRDTHDSKRALTVMAYATTTAALGDSDRASEAVDTDFPSTVGEPFTRPLTTSPSGTPLPPSPLGTPTPETGPRESTYDVLLHSLGSARARGVRRLIAAHTTNWLTISALKSSNVLIAVGLSDVKAEALRADLEEAGASASVEERDPK
ncbi:MAG TPA: hypothetical protein VFY54_16305 [Rubrobacter sp.]|nr:hypothetical protein [Rubrobacter sp.]